VEQSEVLHQQRSEMSFDEIYQALRMSIKQDDKKWRYVVSVWPDHFVYEEDGENAKSSSTRSTSSLTRS
jgi:hypothetical protein